MGQNVNYLLGNQTQLMGADPEVYRQQLIQQEQQRIGALAPNLQLGAQLGGLLGRGISNVAQGRGFMEVTNPVLQKLTQIQDVYNTSLQDSDPNDPMSFYTNLQKNFASAGLGQQALMATEQLKKYEEMNLKGEKLRTEVYKDNPSLLDEKIAQARSAGDDPLANRLAEQRGQIQVKIDMDRAKEIADINYKNAATAAQKATAARQLSDIEAGKSDWKPISEYPNGPPVAFAILDKKTKQITYEKIGGGEYVPAPSKGGTTPPAGSGEKANASDFDKRITPPSVSAADAAPVAAPVAPTQPVAGQPTAWNDATKTYSLAQDPVIQGIRMSAAQNRQQLETDPQFQAVIQKAMNDRIAQIKQQYGSGINIQ